MSDAILSHDLGTTGNKATLVDAAGMVIASATVPYPTDFGPHGKAEQDPEDWWSAVCTATRLLLGRAPTTRVAAVSFSGQMHAAVLLDGEGAPVRPAIIWADTRASAQVHQLVQRYGMAEAYAVTGHRFNATYTLPKVMWVRDTEPEAFARAATVLHAKDFVVQRLTGVQATDPSEASGSDAFDQRSGSWSDDILAAAEVPASVLPQIVPSASVVGTVTRDASAACGLPVGTPVVIGGGDGPMAALGSGVVGPESGAYVYVGSSSWVSLATDRPMLDPLMRTTTFNHVVPGRFLPTASVQAGGAALQWIVEVLDPAGDDPYGTVLAEAAGVEASRDGLYFLPHLLGERSPYWNPNARAVFAGLARHHGRPHLVRAVLEGVAFNLASGLVTFAENGVPATAVDAIGGAARSSLLLQLFADAWDVPVRRRSLVDEATSLGAAVVGGVAVGMYPDFTAGATMSSRSEPHMPDTTRAEEYHAARGRFVDAYRRLEPWFDAGA